MLDKYNNLLAFSNKYEPRHEKTNNVAPTRPDTNQAAQPPQTARGLKIWI